MKMTKKVLMGAVAALALVVGLTSCADLGLSGLLQKAKAFGDVNFKYQDATYDKGNGTWTVDNEENTSTTDYVRGGQLLLTKHSDIAGVVTIKDQGPRSYDGVMGVLFDVKKQKVADNDLYDMIIVGVRNKEGEAQYYVSYFANVSEANLGKNNLGAVKSDGKTSNTKPSFVAGSTECYEIVLKDFTTLPGIAPDANGNVVVIVDVDEDDKTGDYSVKLYDSSVYEAKKHTYSTKDKTPKSTCSIPASKIGKTKAEQAGIGAYAAVYKADAADKPKKLNATLEILDLTNGALAE